MSRLQPIAKGNKMHCFICHKTEENVVLVELPVVTLFRNIHLEIMGNVLDHGEYICLPCIGFEFDDALKKQGLVLKFKRGKRRIVKKN
jgi:hypothetical protein